MGSKQTMAEFLCTGYGCNIGGFAVQNGFENTSRDPTKDQRAMCSVDLRDARINYLPVQDTCKKQRERKSIKLLIP